MICMRISWEPTEFEDFASYDVERRDDAKFSWHSVFSIGSQDVREVSDWEFATGPEYQVHAVRSDGSRVEVPCVFEPAEVQ